MEELVSVKRGGQSNNDVYIMGRAPFESTGKGYAHVR